MKIVALIKQVPDTYSERKLSDSDQTLDREGTEAVIDEINERAVEAALQLKEAHDGSEVVVVCMGPDRATDAIRKALSMGADAAVHLSDEAIHGSCAVQTAKALTKAIGTVEGWDLVVAGEQASDGQIGAVPAMVADVLGVPALTHVVELSVDGVDGDGEAGDRRRGDAPVGGVAGGGVDRGEGQRAALPVVQGDHGGEEEAGGDPGSGGCGDRGVRGGSGERADHGHERGAEAAEAGR